MGIIKTADKTEEPNVIYARNLRSSKYYSWCLPTVLILLTTSKGLKVKKKIGQKDMSGWVIEDMSSNCVEVLGKFIGAHYYMNLNTLDLIKKLECLVYQDVLLTKLELNSFFKIDHRDKISCRVFNRKLEEVWEKDKIYCFMGNKRVSNKF